MSVLKGLIPPDLNAPPETVPLPAFMGAHACAACVRTCVCVCGVCVCAKTLFSSANSTGKLIVEPGEATSVPAPASSPNAAEPAAKDKSKGKGKKAAGPPAEEMHTVSKVEDDLFGSADMFSKNSMLEAFRDDDVDELFGGKPKHSSAVDTL